MSGIFKYTCTRDITTRSITSPTVHVKTCLRCYGMRRVSRVDAMHCPTCEGTGQVNFAVRFTTHANTPQREHVDISFDELIALIGLDEAQSMTIRAEHGDPYTAYWDASVSHYAILMEVQ